MTIIISLLVLSLVIFVHEFGHFISARKLGVGVEEFGFGFPPRIASWRRRNTLYSINWIPFGGFVKLKGESGSDTASPDSFANQSIPRRLVVITAGVIMNVLLAWFLFSFVFVVGIPSVVDSSALKHGGRLLSSRVQIVQLVPGSPAERAGLTSGDVVISINDQPALNSQAADDIIDQQSGQMTIVLERNHTRFTYQVTRETLSGETEPRIGVALADTGDVSYPWYNAIWLGPLYAIKIIGLIFSSFGTIISNLISQGTLSSDISGPIGITVIAGQVAKLGLVYVIQFAAILSLSLACLNILPIPAFDGGRVLFIIIEAIRGRPVNQKLEAVIHTVGFYLLLLLLIFVSYRDFFRFQLNDKISELFK